MVGSPHSAAFTLSPDNYATAAVHSEMFLTELREQIQQAEKPGGMAGLMYVGNLSPRSE